MRRPCDENHGYRILPAADAAQAQSGAVRNDSFEKSDVGSYELFADAASLDET